MVKSATRQWRGLGTVANVSLGGLVLLIALIVMGPYLYTVSPTLVAGRFWVQRHAAVLRPC